MSDFKPGDKVALVNEETKGEVLSIIDSHTVLVELEEGLEIPVKTNQLVKQSDFFNEAEKEEPGKGTAPPGKPGKSEGVYLAFDNEKSDQKLDLLLLNNTPFEISFSFFESYKDHYRGVSHGDLSPQSYRKLCLVDLGNFGHWPLFVLHILYFATEGKELPSPVIYRFKPRARVFFKALKHTPLLNRDAYLFKIEPQWNRFPAAGFKTGPEKQESGISAIEKPQRVVDLHIEKLVPGKENMEPAQILKLQLDQFKNCLEKAMALNYPEIVFIHGVGKGKLKQEIYQYLDNTEGIREYREGKQSEYGSGATEIILEQKGS